MIGWIKNLMKDSLVYGIGFGVSRFLQIIVLPIIAHALSLSEYGYYSNYVIFYSIAGGVFVLGMDSSVARFMFDSEDKNYHRKLFSISFFCLLIVSLLFSTICLWYPASLLKIINVPEAYSKALPYTLFIIPCLVMNNFFLSWFKWKREKYYFLINTIGTVFFLLIPLLLIKKMSFLFVFQTIFFGQLVVVIISTVLVRDYIRFVFDGPLLGALLKYGFPWMLVYFLGLSRSYLDRFFLTRYLNDDAYGIYNFSVRLSTLLSLVLTAFDMSFGPLAFSIWNKEGAAKFFARLQSAYTFLISTVACVIVIISPWLVQMLGGQKYQGAERVLPYLLFSAIPLSLINFSSLGIMYAKKSFLSTVTLVIGFSTVLLLNMLLTPRYLQFGAVNASIIGHILIVSTGYYLSQRFYKIHFHFAKDGLLFLFFLALSIALVEFHFTNHMYQDIIMKLLLLAVVALFMLMVFFQSEYKKSISFLKNIRYAGIRRNARV
jgi:O-antigen/teichoic acid export membrane protein